MSDNFHKSNNSWGIVMDCKEKDSDKGHSTNNALTVFEEKDPLSPQIYLENGKPWWVCSDVARYLEYKTNNMNELFRLVPNIWKGRRRIPTLGGPQEKLCTCQEGLLLFLARSDKPGAIPYQMKVAGEIMPAILEKGIYVAHGASAPIDFQSAITDPRNFFMVVDKWKETWEEKIVAEARVVELEEQAVIDAPLKAFATAVMARGTNCTIAQLAIRARNYGVNCPGGNGVFKFLRDIGEICKSGTRRNLPTVQGQNHGLVEIIKLRTNKEGNVVSYAQTQVTPEGQVYYVNLLKKTFGTIECPAQGRLIKLQ
jgi:prophage antirepressor-like protein